MDDTELSLNQSHYLERENNLKYIRILYILVLLEIVAAIAWASAGRYWEDPFGNGIKRYWWVALIAGIICIVLIIMATFVRKVQRSPISIAIYGVFLIFFMYAVGYLAIVDTSGLVYYALWVLFAIILAFALYSHFADYYLRSIESIVAVILAALAVLFAFIMFSDIATWKLILVTVPAVILGYYINTSLRTIVRNSLFDHDEEDPFNGAVRIWLEGCFVFCRMGELTGKQFAHRYT